MNRLTIHEIGEYLERERLNAARKSLSESLDDYGQALLKVSRLEFDIIEHCCEDNKDLFWYEWYTGNLTIEIVKPCCGCSVKEEIFLTQWDNLAGKHQEIKKLIISKSQAVCRSHYPTCLFEI